jgi:hypothetical protein
MYKVHPSRKPKAEVATCLAERTCLIILGYEILRDAPKHLCVFLQDIFQLSTR